MLSIECMNRHTIELLQASWGSITPNIQAIWLQILSSKDFIIGFSLDEESEIDTNAIEDIVVDFEALQEGGYSLEINKVFENLVPSQLPQNSRLIYLRWSPLVDED